MVYDVLGAGLRVDRALVPFVTDWMGTKMVCSTRST